MVKEKKKQGHYCIVHMLKWYLWSPLTSCKGMKPAAKDVGLRLFCVQSQRSLGPRRAWLLRKEEHPALRFWQWVKGPSNDPCLFVHLLISCCSVDNVRSFRRSALSTIFWAKLNTSCCSLIIWVGPKVNSVFPHHLMEKTRQTFGPTQ